MDQAVHTDVDPCRVTAGSQNPGTARFGAVRLRFKSLAPDQILNSKVAADDP